MRDDPIVAPDADQILEDLTPISRLEGGVFIGDPLGTKKSGVKQIPINRSAVGTTHFNSTNLIKKENNNNSVASSREIYIKILRLFGYEPLLHCMKTILLIVPKLYLGKPHIPNLYSTINYFKSFLPDQKGPKNQVFPPKAYLLRNPKVIVYVLFS